MNKPKIFEETLEQSLVDNQLVLITLYNISNGTSSDERANGMAKHFSNQTKELMISLRTALELNIGLQRILKDFFSGNSLIGESEFNSKIELLIEKIQKKSNAQV